MASLGFLFDIYEVLVAPLVLQPAVMELGGFSPGTSDYRYSTGLLSGYHPWSAGFAGYGAAIWRIALGAAASWSGASCFTRCRQCPPGCRRVSRRCSCFARCALPGICVDSSRQSRGSPNCSPIRNTRGRARLYTVVLLPGRSSGRRRFLSRQSLWYRLTRNLRRTFRMALHVDLRFGSRNSFDAHPALPAGISSVAAPPFRRDAQRPSVAELFRPDFRRSTVVTALLFACAYGAAFGTVQQSPQVAAATCRKSGSFPPPSAAKRPQARRPCRNSVVWREIRDCEPGPADRQPPRAAENIPATRPICYRHCFFLHRHNES